jgi:hypothetical protein
MDSFRRLSLTLLALLVQRYKYKGTNTDARLAGIALMDSFLAAKHGHDLAVKLNALVCFTTALLLLLPLLISYS